MSFQLRITGRRAPAFREQQDHVAPSKRCYLSQSVALTVGVGGVIRKPLNSSGPEKLAVWVTSCITGNTVTVGQW
jgi:hypothetical protein